VLLPAVTPGSFPYRPELMPAVTPGSFPYRPELLPAVTPGSFPNRPMLMPAVLGKLNTLLVKAGRPSFPGLTNAEAGEPDDCDVTLHFVFRADVSAVSQHMFTSAVFSILPAAGMADSVQGAVHWKTLPRSNAEEAVPVPSGKLASNSPEILDDEIGEPRVQNVIPVKTDDSPEELSNAVTDDLLVLVEIQESSGTEHFRGTA
jgi:hypothetical protein